MPTKALNFVFAKGRLNILCIRLPIRRAQSRKASNRGNHAEPGAPSAFSTRLQVGQRFIFGGLRLVAAFSCAIARFFWLFPELVAPTRSKR
jgi:hypothetical protein